MSWNGMLKWRWRTGVVVVGHDLRKRHANANATATATVHARLIKRIHKQRQIKQKSHTRA